MFAVGLTLKYHKTSNSGKDKKEQADAEELVLTSMSFTSGLHFWEFIAPISCNSMRKCSPHPFHFRACFPIYLFIVSFIIIEFGVYNPVSRVQLLASFKTTTPRVVTVCLDLN